MFDNLRVTSRVVDQQIAIDLQWLWNYEEGKKLPECNVFCCKIPENRLLKESIFSQQEIKNWINRELIDISVPETRIYNIEAYANNPVTNKNCVLYKYQLNNGGNIFATQQLRFPMEDSNKIFFVCIYSDSNFESMVLSVADPEMTVPFEFIEPGFMDKLRGKKQNSLRFSDSGDRRRVLVTDFEGAPVYSIVPNGNFYYIDKDVTRDDIKQAIYLSSLIGD